jgi:hypothetical protein
MRPLSSASFSAPWPASRILLEASSRTLRLGRRSVARTSARGASRPRSNSHWRVTTSSSWRPRSPEYGRRAPILRPTRRRSSPMRWCCVLRISGARPGRELEVAITGAFLTGQPLDARISEYSGFQRALGDALRDLPDEGWDYVRWRGMPTYASGGGFASMVPLVLVHRDDGEFLARAKHVFNERHESERHWLDELMRGWGWRPATCGVEGRRSGRGPTGVFGRCRRSAVDRRTRRVWMAWR